MKKFGFFNCAALAALLLNAPAVHAKYILSAPVDIAGELNGMEVAFEGYSDDSNLGGYLGPLKHRADRYNLFIPALTRFEGEEIPADIIWVIEQLDSVCTQDRADGATKGRRLYRLKHKASGEYIGAEWSPNGGNHEDCIFMVDNADEAAAFAFFRSSDQNEFGSMSYGSFTPGWMDNGAAMTIVDLYANDAWNRGFVCNESNENIKGFGQYQDTNVWLMHRYYDATTGRDFLTEFLGQMPTNWMDLYKVGNEPGFVNDEDRFGEFYDLWSYAVDNLESMSDEECWSTLNKLDTLYSWLQSDESMVPIEDGGYYYFYTANEDFTIADNGGFAIYAPKNDEPRYLGWKAFDENDPSFIWQIKTVGTASGTEYEEIEGTAHYSIKNMGSGVYINQSSSKNDSQPVEWSSEFQNYSLLLPMNHAGHWHISDRRDWNEYPPRPFHQDGHDEGAGKSGRIVIFEGGIGSPSDWIIKKVPQEQIDRLASMQNRTSLLNCWAENGGLANGIDTVLDAPGYISSEEVLNEYREAEAEADTMLNYSEGKSYTDEEYGEVYRRFLAAAEAYKANRDRGLEDGYYRIQLTHWFARRNDPNYYMQIVDGRPGWARTPAATVSQIWKVTRIQGDRYYVQNMGNGKYLGKAEANLSWQLMNFSNAAEVPQIIKPYEAMCGQFYFTNGVDSAYHYDDGDHLEGTASSAVLRYYEGMAVDAGTSWAFIPIPEEEYQAIQAADAQTTLRYELENALKTAKRLYNKNTVYTRGEKIINDASQLYSNNSSVDEGKDFNALIDDNIDTWWNSAWDTESEDATHYLRFETTASEGLPDSVMLYSRQRNNGEWHRSPSKMRVSVSNDASGWKELPSLIEKADLGSEDISVFSTEPVYTLVTGIKGYKYVRFEFLAVQPHYEFHQHPIAEFSEVNLFPVTGVDEESSLTCTAGYKNLAAGLFAAIQKGQQEFASGGTVAQETVDELNKAILDFNGKNIADSAVSMAKLNIQNFTPGDRIGEFTSAESLETYETEAQAAIDSYENAESVTGELVESTNKRLADAFNKLYSSMVRPEEGKWYVLQLADASMPERSDNVMTADGRYTHQSGGDSYWLTNKTIGDAAAEERASFVFKGNADGTYTIQCVGTGFYNGPETESGAGTHYNRPVQWSTPDSVTIIPFGDGQIGLRLRSGSYFYQNPEGTDDAIEYRTHDGTQGQDSKYAWTPMLTEIATGGFLEQPDTVEQGRVIAITKPYELDGLPVTDSGVLQGYKVVGKLTAEGSADSIVTAYQLQKLPEEEVIPAGYPVVYIADNGSGAYDADTRVGFAFKAVMNSEVRDTADAVNGLVGCLDQMRTPADHYGYFLEDSVADEPANTLIDCQRAVLVPWLVEQNAQQVDKVVYVKGSGMLNGVKQTVAVEDQSELVDVYGVDGVLVRRGVARRDAVAGLAKGVYVVGKKKVLVK